MSRTIFAALGLALLSPLLRASEADALAISANIQAKHLPYGTILDPVYASAASDQITGYTRCGDSAIWTGHYLAAEAFRYAVTNSSDALANVKSAIAGLKSLADVTGTNLLARCLAPEDSPFAAGIESEEQSNGIYTNTPAGLIWVGNTSRDQFVGAFFGLSVAYDLVGDASVRSSIGDLVTRLDGFLTGHNWAVTMPDGSTSTTFLLRPDEILMIMEVAQHINPATFTPADQVFFQSILHSSVLPVQFDTASNSSYFKFNLDYDTLYNLIRLGSGDPVAVYDQAYSVLRDHTAGHQNAFFNMIDRALNGPSASRDAETLTLLNEWLLRSRRDQYVDNSQVVKVCGSEACSPILVPLRPPTDFLWQRDPFQLAGGGQGLIESAGIDYILPYWMARYYGLSTPFVAQSAAAASPAVAPDSLASLYGSNLTSPGGNPGLTITDSAGFSAAALIIYSSPAQINFAVPAGLAAGAATFTLANGTSQSSAPGVIWPVVPRLFTLNASEVAAASAIESDPASPAVQTPVTVSQCGASGCIPVAIDVSSGKNVYLTLYGTGIRNRGALSDVSVQVNGLAVPVLYAGAQAQFPGLDQVNVELPATLAGAGISNVVLTLSGQSSNGVVIGIK